MDMMPSGSYRAIASRAESPIRQANSSSQSEFGVTSLAATLLRLDPLACVAMRDDVEDHIGAGPAFAGLSREPASTRNSGGSR